MGSGSSCSQPETQTGLARFLKLLRSKVGDFSEFRTS